MREILLEAIICAVAAAFLMIVHELSKAMLYMALQRLSGSKRVYRHSIWEVYRYIDPIGIILSVTSSVPFSRPFMFRIQDKKLNRILGITGFAVLLLCFICGMLVLKLHVGGVSGMIILEGRGIFWKVVTLFFQYLTLLSFGMFLANLFPVSTFDMGLLIAGFSAEKYLNIIKKDALIKIIFLITIFLGLIHYGGYRFISFIL